MDPKEFLRGLHYYLRYENGNLASGTVLPED